MNAHKYPPLCIDGTGSSVPSNVLDDTHPRITRPLNNRTLWEDGVLDFSQGTVAAPNWKTSQVYGLMWKLQDKDNQYYMAHVRFYCGAHFLSNCPCNFVRDSTSPSCCVCHEIDIIRVIMPNQVVSLEVRS